MLLCVDCKFSRAVLRKISFVSSLSLSFSSLTAFRSTVDETTSESDNPRTRLEILRFPYSLCRRCFCLICIAMSDREMQSLTIYRQACVHTFARDRNRDRASNCPSDEERFSNTRLLRIGRNHAIGSPDDRQLSWFSLLLLFAQKFHPAKFNVSRIDDKRRIWLASNHFRSTIDDFSITSCTIFVLFDTSCWISVESFLFAFSFPSNGSLSTSVSISFSPVFAN